ncbi:hypothetical protein AB4567_21270, partial [Vibrio sp. 10N.222.51.A6]
MSLYWVNWRVQRARGDHRYDQFKVKRLAKKFSEMRVLNVALFPPRKPGGRRTHNAGPVLLGIQQR